MTKPQRADGTGRATGRDVVGDFFFQSLFCAERVAERLEATITLDRQSGVSARPGHKASAEHHQR